MMGALGDAVREHLRLVLLRALVELPAYRGHQSLLRDLAEGQGLVLPIDTVRAQLDWLAEQGLVALSPAAGGKVTATLTDRGHDVAEGRARATGVKRPAPQSAAAAALDAAVRMGRD